MLNWNWKSQIVRMKLVALMLAATIPFSMGSTVGWDFHNPTGSANPHPRTNLNGTGDAPASTPGKNITFKIFKSDGDLNKQVSGTTFTSGGWYLVIPGPLTTGNGQKAELWEGTTLRATAPDASNPGTLVIN